MNCVHDPCFGDFCLYNYYITNPSWICFSTSHHLNIYVLVLKLFWNHPISICLQFIEIIIRQVAKNSFCSNPICIKCKLRTYKPEALLSASKIFDVEVIVLQEISHVYNLFGIFIRGRRNRRWRYLLWHETFVNILVLEKYHSF